jgi:hypothetical protein
LKSRRLSVIGSRVLIAVACFPIVSGSHLSSMASGHRTQSKRSVALRLSPIFSFYDDEFWLNLHHFLYVLGRAENKTKDSARAAVSGAPADQRQGMALLTEREQTIWKEAVLQYAAGPSKKDIVFDDPLPAVTISLARARQAKSPAGIEATLAALLIRAAPVYRKAWWPKHRAANKAWKLEIESLVKRYGRSVLAFISKAYHLEWAAAGYDVHLSAYTNWAGAYSTTGNLLVMSSLNKETQGTDGLETVFHEGMHQWDDEIALALSEQAQRLNKPVPEKLSHALIFFTAGAAVRSVVPEHIPYADRSGVWLRGMTRERDVLTEIWKPYLEGNGTRDEAFVALISRLSSK